MSLEIASARSLERGERAELFTSAYEGYLLPFRIDEQQLAAMDEAFDLARGLATDAGAAVYRQPGENVQLVQVAGEAEPLLRLLRRLGTVGVLNLPAGDAAEAALRSLGATVVVRQHEMLLGLGEH